NRTFFAISRIFDRQSGDASFCAESRILRAPVWFVSVTVFEIGVYWNVSRFNELFDVRDHVVAFHQAVGDSARERETRGCGGDRFEAEMLQILRRAWIPRVRKSETPFFMEFSKLCALLFDRFHKKTGHECTRI